VALEWRADTLRLTIFSNGPIKLTDADWKTITGQDMSDNRQIVPGGIVLSGRFENHRLQVVSVGGRLDAILTAAGAAGAEEPAWSTLGPADEWLKKLLNLTAAWRDSTHFPIVRIALAGSFIIPTSSQIESLSILKERLYSVKIDDQMREFQFRVNRPTPSTVVPNFVINRLVTWTALQLVVALIPIAPNTPSVPSTTLEAARIEIDMNTDPNRQEPIDREAVSVLLDELRKFASDSLVHGEKP